MTATLFNETDNYVSQLLRSEAWSALDTDKKNAIFKRAAADISACANSSGADINFENNFVKLAVFEQTIHIAEELCRSCNGSVLTSETITGFGSIKYDNPDHVWISPRAQAYLQTAIKQRPVKITR
jgi:hypothetical protein